MCAYLYIYIVMGLGIFKIKKNIFCVTECYECRKLYMHDFVLTILNIKYSDYSFLCTVENI